MMPDIVHRVAIMAPPSRVYRAIATRSGLINWWTWHVTGEPASGRVVRVRFARGEAGMEMRELTPDTRVVWRCVSGPAEWIDTEISFSLVPT
ncbi:MAG TPA: SRPBCC domain-containing protein, partial [Spirochaetia bacterium]|nr:SRPBCC domain-containing protein [Spirochaetia bacterium]